MATNTCSLILKHAQVNIFTLTVLQTMFCAIDCK